MFSEDENRQAAAMIITDMERYERERSHARIVVEIQDGKACFSESTKKQLYRKKEPKAGN